MVTPASLYRQMPSARQRTRRILVIVGFVGFPMQQLGYASLVANGILPIVVWGPITVVLFAATIVGVLAIYGFGQGRIDQRERLDERQRQLVDRALVTSYAVLTIVIVALAGILAAYLSFVGPIQLEMAQLTPWVIAIGLYVPFLPFAALAWIEPDAPADDEA